MEPGPSAMRPCHERPHRGRTRGKRVHVDGEVSGLRGGSRQPRGVRRHRWAAALLVTALLAACGHAGTPAQGSSATTAPAAGPSRHGGAPASTTTGSAATGATRVAVQKAKIRLLGLVHRPQGVSVIDPLPPRTGAVQDVFAVSTPTAPGCSTGPGTCGSVLWASTNAGRNWTVRYASTRWNIQGVDFIRSMDGWARVRPSGCGGGARPCPDQLWYTHNGGTRWQPVAYGGTDAAALYALNQKDVWVVGVVHRASGGPCSIRPCTLRIFATTDGGQKWTEQYHAPDAATGGAGNAVTGLTAHLGRGGKLEAWVLLSGGQVLALRGGTWRAVGRITRGVPALSQARAGGIGQCMQFLNRQDGWLSFCELRTAAGGCRNRLYGTRNGGRTWTPLFHTRGESQWIAVAMRTRRRGIMVVGGVNPGYQGPSNGNTILATNDGGRTWRHLDAPPGGIDAAAFATGQLWIVGGLGFHCACQTTVLEGATTTWHWHVRGPIQDVPNFPDVALVDGHLVGFAAGPSHRVVVLASARGTTWRPVGQLPRVAAVYLDGLHATPDGPFMWLNVPCAASPARLCQLVSRNAGVTWSRQALRSCHAAPPCRAPAGSVAQKHPTPLPAGYGPVATAWIPGGKEIVAAMRRSGTRGGSLFLPTVGGRWRQVRLPGIQPERIAFATPAFGLLATLDGRFFVTTDGGGHWTQIP